MNSPSRRIDQCGRVVRFPGRRIAAVLVIPEALGGFYTIALDRGWLFGSFEHAMDAARELAAHHGLPVKVMIS